MERLLLEQKGLGLRSSAENRRGLSELAWGYNPIIGLPDRSFLDA